MNLLIDNLDSVTDWTVNGGTSSIYGLNTHDMAIAGDLDNSLILYFNGLDSYAQKIYGSPIDVSDYDYIVLHIYSRLLGSTDYKKAEDFSYKIDFGDNTKEYYIPAFSDFSHFYIDLTGVTSIERIRITALTATADYIVVSYMLAVFDELPYDVFTGVKTKLDSIITDSYLSRFLVGTVSGTLGDDSITFGADVPWIDRYSVIRILGAVDEYHQISKRDGNTFYFTSLYDGKTLTQTVVGVSVYLHIPVEYGREQKEIIFPAITFWGFESALDPGISGLDHYVDTYHVTDDTFMERQEGRYQDWHLFFDCDAHEEELLAVCSEIVRKFLNRQKVWVNGVKTAITQDGPPTETRSTESFDIIPKVTYTAKLSVKEEAYDRVLLQKTLAIDYTNIIQET